MLAARANTVGEDGFSMPRTLQTATILARGICCSLREALPVAHWHNANMSEESKNGGPNFLKAWREHRGLSQEELAEKAGTTPSVVSLLEAGERGLSLKWLRRLARPLGITPGQLADFMPGDQGAEILNMWEGIDPKERKRALTVLRGFSEDRLRDTR